MSQAAKDRERRRQLYAIAIVAIIALLGINIYLLMGNKSKEQVIVQQEKQLDKADELRKKLNEEYQAALADLDAKAQENEELREIVAQQKEKLKQMYKKIDRNISRGVKNESLLKQAQAQIASLKVKGEDYVATIDSLTAKNVDLQKYSQVLEEEKDELSEVIVAKEEAIALKEEEVKQVEEEKSQLKTKVARGAVLSVRNIEIVPLKIRRNGKEKKTGYARRVEKFNVCFDVIKNELTEAGRNKFHLRILTPTGETIAVEQRGSGTTINQDNDGTEMRYTTVKSFEYDNGEPNLCMDWIQEEKLGNKGEYIFEIYNKGYLAGKKTVKLK
jgi:peptidoglycan hydrolase CwlO-like protein